MQCNCLVECFWVFQTLMELRSIWYVFVVTPIEISKTIYATPPRSCQGDRWKVSYFLKQKFKPNGLKRLRLNMFRILIASRSSNTCFLGFVKFSWFLQIFPVFSQFFVVFCQFYPSFPNFLQIPLFFCSLLWVI